MKAISAAALAFALTLTPAAILLSCKSSAPDAAAKTTDNLGALATDLQHASDRIGAALTSLGSLQAAADANLRPEYDKYVASVAGERLKKDSKAVSEGGKAYFTSWEQSIATLSNPEFQKRSRARLDETKASYAKVEERAMETDKKFDALRSQLKDIKEALGFDLNKAGLANMSDEIEAAAKSGKELQAGFAEAIAKITEVKQAMSASSPAPPPTEPAAK
jgi:hypothetical protein